MRTRSRSDSDEPTIRRRPATTPDGRENQLISAAVDLAEKQILAGTASAQVISHFLKLGSSRERLEQERIRHENELMEAKRQNLQSQANLEALFAEATNAMRAYKGEETLPQSDYYDD